MADGAEDSGSRGRRRDRVGHRKNLKKRSSRSPPRIILGGNNAGGNNAHGNSRPSHEAIERYDLDGIGATAASTTSVALQNQGTTAQRKISGDFVEKEKSAKFWSGIIPPSVRTRKVRIRNKPNRQNDHRPAHCAVCPIPDSAVPAESASSSSARPISVATLLRTILAPIINSSSPDSHNTPLTLQTQKSLLAKALSRRALNRRSRNRNANSNSFSRRVLSCIAGVGVMIAGAILPGVVGQQSAYETTIGQLNIDDCQETPDWKGCNPSPVWAVHNAEYMEEGWRVFELKMYSDRTCQTELASIKSLYSSGYLKCGDTGFRPERMFDQHDSTLWVSQCGRESVSCNGRPDQPPAYGKHGCQKLQSYIAIDFGSPAEVQCVRMLQGKHPYRSPKVTLTSHVGPVCTRCAVGALSLEVPSDDPMKKWDTYAYKEVNMWWPQTKETWPAWPWPQQFHIAKYEEPNIDHNAIMGSWRPCSAKIDGVPDPTCLPEDRFAVTWQGLLRIQNASPDTPYTFFLLCAAEAQLWWEDELMLQNNGTNWEGVFFKESVQINIPSPGVFYIGVRFVSDRAMEEARSGMQLDYLGPDTNNMRIRVPASAFVRGITNDKEVYDYEYDLRQNMHCFGQHYRYYRTIADAQTACDQDSTCSAVYARNCRNLEFDVSNADFDGLFLCQSPLVERNSTENSCVYIRRTPDETVEVTTEPPTKTDSGATVAGFSGLLLLLTVALQSMI